MNILALILSFGTGFLLVLSALFKILSLNAYVKSFNKYKNINKTIRKIIGFLSPFIEMIMGMLLIIFSEFLIINIFSVALFFIFILINVNAVIKREVSSCLCFGKIIETKYGKSGIVQSILLSTSLLPNVFIDDHIIFTDLIHSYRLVEINMFTLTAIIWTLTLILIRTIIDKVSPI